MSDKCLSLEGLRWCGWRFREIFWSRLSAINTCCVWKLRHQNIYLYVCMNITKESWTFVERPLIAYGQLYVCVAIWNLDFHFLRGLLALD